MPEVPVKNSMLRRWPLSAQNDPRTFIIIHLFLPILALAQTGSPLLQVCLLKRSLYSVENTLELKGATWTQPSLGMVSRTLEASGETAAYDT